MRAANSIKCLELQVSECSSGAWIKARVEAASGFEPLHRGKKGKDKK
jgi:hypothetical protein